MPNSLSPSLDARGIMALQAIYRWDWHQTLDEHRPTCKKSVIIAFRYLKSGQNGVGLNPKAIFFNTVLHFPSSKR
jgi:hypothetical protein